MKKIKLGIKPRSFSGTIFSLSMPVNGKSFPISWNSKTFSPATGVSVGEILISDPASAKDLERAGLSADDFFIAKPEDFRRSK